jgi:hypothetical protein
VKFVWHLPFLKEMKCVKEDGIKPGIGKREGDPRSIPPSCHFLLCFLLIFLLRSAKFLTSIDSSTADPLLADSHGNQLEIKQEGKEIENVSEGAKKVDHFPC